MAVISLYHAQYGHLYSECILLQSTRRQYKEGIRLAILVQGIKRITQWYICTNVHFNSKGCVDMKNQKICMEGVLFPLRIYQHRYNIIVFPWLLFMYRRRGKIRWAKHSWFQRYEVFRRNTFVVHWPPVFITYLKLKIHGKTFAVLSKTAKTTKS